MAIRNLFLKTGGCMSTIQAQSVWFFWGKPMIKKADYFWGGRLGWG